MARAKFVKKARRAVPEAGIEVGDSYYWWKFRFGGKHFSKTPPKPSQLTQSNYLSQILEIQERTFDRDDPENFVEEVKGDLESLKDELEGNLENMPEGLQQGDTGQLLQERIDSLDQAITDLESIDMQFEDDISEEEKEDKINEIESEYENAVGELG